MSSAIKVTWLHAPLVYHGGMTRLFAFALALLHASLGLPATAQEELDSLPLDARARVLSAEAIGNTLADPNNPGQAQVSQLYETGSGYTLCATTDARNANGSYIGRTYWEVRLSPDGAELVGARDVTGLLSPCYGVDYQPFQELLTFGRDAR